MNHHASMICRLWTLCFALSLITYSLSPTPIAAEPAPAEPAPAKPAPAAAPSPVVASLPLVVWVDGPLSHLSVVDVSASPPSIKLAGTLSDITKDKGQALRLATASDGVHVCTVHATTSSSPLSVSWGPLTAPLTADAPLPSDLQVSDLYTALSSGSRCYLGASNARVIEVDFSATPPAVRAFPPPEAARGSEHKSVDVLIDTGSALLAVDDVMSPFYTFTFDKNASGALTYRQTVSLGDELNLTYQWGFHHNGVIGLFSTTNHRGGWGQELTFYPASAFTDPANADTRRLPSLGHLSESQARDPAPGTSNTKGLLGGTTWTPLLGAAVSQKHLLIAAGARGVLVSPWDPDKGAGKVTGKVTVADVGGPCLDIQARGDQVWILRQRDGAAEVVQVVWDAASERLVDVQVIKVAEGAKSFL